MKTLTFRTDRPEAEIGVYDGKIRLAYVTWTAHRQLAETIHSKLDEVCQTVNLEMSDVSGIIIFAGPGSFTGLRIGMAVANALAYSLQIPIIATSGEFWIESGVKQLENGSGISAVVPEYGAAAITTLPRTSAKR